LNSIPSELMLAVAAACADDAQREQKKVLVYCMSGVTRCAAAAWPGAAGYAPAAAAGEAAFADILTSAWHAEAAILRCSNGGA
jgi:predicted protein tyrosine phosphatase